MNTKKEPSIREQILDGSYFDKPFDVRNLGIEFAIIKAREDNFRKNFEIVANEILHEKFPDLDFKYVLEPIETPITPEIAKRIKELKEDVADALGFRRAWGKRFKSAFANW